MDCSPPGSAARGISQARTPKWVAIHTHTHTHTHISVHMCVHTHIHIVYIYIYVCWTFKIKTFFSVKDTVEKLKTEAIGITENIYKSQI